MYTSSLNVQNREIRVIAIRSSNGQANQVECDLSTVSLQEDPKYIALSYAWGDPNLTEPILVNGHPFQATRNLAAALREFQRRQIQEAFWIDAICINQNDSNDKSTQIPLMQDIYATAHGTIIWLGEATTDSHLGLNLIRKWSALQEQVKLGLKMWYKGASQQQTMIPADMVILHQDSAPGLRRDIGVSLAATLDANFDKSEYDALLSIWRRPYWGRVWIIQELCLSRNITFLLGQDEVDYETFQGGYPHILDQTPFSLADTLSTAHLDALSECRSTLVEDLMKLKRSYPYKSNDSLWDAILDTRNRKAARPHDHIYAILGLVKSNRVSVPIEYQLEPAVVFEKLAVQFINDPEVKLDTLCLAGNGIDDYQISNLPSWVPNFADPGQLYRRRWDFCAWHDEALNSSVAPVSNMLILDGIIAFEVTETRVWTESIHETLKEWISLAESQKPHPSGFPQIQVFFRTFTQDDTESDTIQHRNRSFVHVQEFFDRTFGFVNFLGELALHDINGPRPSTIGECRDFLSRYLDSAGIDEYFRLPLSIQNLALWLVMSSRKPIKLSLSNILEAFGGRHGTEASLDWPRLTPTSTFDFATHANFETHIVTPSKERRDTFFVTSDGYMGLGPRGMKSGDMICVIPRCPYPLAIRRREQTDHFQLVGACYVYGLMMGEVKMMENREQRIQKIIFT